MFSHGQRYGSTITGSINPKHIKVTWSSFTALLNRSKTIGDDKSSHSRPLIIDSACYLHSKEWMQTGWELLSDSANFERDFLLPAPSTNYRRVVRSELRYATVYAMQNRVLSSLSLDGSRIFIYPVTHYWTPHSSPSYLPSAALLLDFPKVQRDFLGGWNAQASDRYARTASRSITNMQKGRHSCPSLTKSGPALGARPGRTFRIISQVTTRSSRRHCAMFISPEVACAPSRPF